MKGFRVLVYREHAADFLGRRSLDRFFADLAHVFKLEHVEFADQADFYIQIRHYLFPPSHSFRSLRAFAAISWPQMMVAE